MTHREARNLKKGDQVLFDWDKAQYLLIGYGGDPSLSNPIYTVKEVHTFLWMTFVTIESQKNILNNAPARSLTRHQYTGGGFAM